MTDVAWVGWDGEEPRGYWDQAFLETLFSEEDGFAHHIFREGQISGLTGAVVVGMHAFDADRINAAIAPLDWCLIVNTNDEESRFPWRDIVHPNCAVWVSTPRVVIGADARRPDRYLGFGPTPFGLQVGPITWDDRPVDVFFAGQVTHSRRIDSWRAMNRLKVVTDLEGTKQFGTGMDPYEYASRILRAKIAPCPSGAASTDSFRAYEALEAGVLPIVDAICPLYEVPGYWDLVFPGGVPFPVVTDWHTLPNVVSDALGAWPSNAQAAHVWWTDWKTETRDALHQTIKELSA